MKLPTKTVVEVNQELAGQVVRHTRKLHGISLRSLAKELDISAPYLSDLERGRRDWNPELFNRVEKAMNTLK